MKRVIGISAAALVLGFVLVGCGSDDKASSDTKTTSEQADTTASTDATTTTTIAGPIFTQNGTGTATTASFKVPNNWDLAWSYDCAAFFGGTGNFIVTIYDLTGSAGGSASSGGNMDFDNQGINQLGAKGNGVEHYHSGGNEKYLKIVSECSWSVTVTKA